VAEIKGGCLCGAVRYTAEAEQTGAIICHCTDCQKFTGAAFAPLVPVQKEALTLTGPVKTHSALGGSGNPVLRNFCAECGSSLFEEPQARPGLAILFAGTLDEPMTVSPIREIFRDDAFPWVHVEGDIPRFAKRAG
jgi:hypothetical protein